MRELTRKPNQITDIVGEAKLESLLEGDTTEELVQAQQKVSHYCQAIAELPPHAPQPHIAKSYNQPIAVFPPLCLNVIREYSVKAGY